MADTKVDYLISPEGKVVASTPDDTDINLATGYLPAGAKQIADFKKEEAFREKYGTPLQKAATVAEGAGAALSFGVSTGLERAVGVPAEDIRARKEVNPGYRTAGTVAGVAAPLLITGGASALAGGAELTAPGLIARLGEGASAAAKGALGEGTTALGRIGIKAASSGAAGLAEGTAYGAGQVLDEAAMGDPHITASNVIKEVGLSGLLGFGIGGTSGALGSLIGEGASGSVGRKLEEWTHRFEGNRNLSAAGGGANVQALVKREASKLGLEGVNQLGREGGEMGLVGPLTTPEETWARSEEAMSKASEIMDEQKSLADSVKNNKAPSAARVAARARNEILKPLEDNFADTGEAAQFEKIVNGFEEKYGAADPKNKLSFSDLHDARKILDTKIYGLKGNQVVATEFKDALHDFRSMLSEEINSGLDATKGLDSTAWKAANRQYQVAYVFQKFAEKGMTAARGNNILPLSTILGTLAGHVTGGPAGAAALGAISYGAKRFGSGLLGAGARSVRNLIDESAAEGLASKTAEAISAAREEGAATRAQALWGKLSEKLERPGAVGQDIARDSAQERIGPKETPTPVETVAALSQLQGSNLRGKSKTDKLVDAVFSPKPTKAGTLRGVGAALSAKSEDEYLKKMEHIHHLANTPQAMLEHINRQTHDMHEHAPKTASALAETAARTVTYLHNAFPGHQKTTPLGPTPSPSRAELFAYNQAAEVIQDPSRILKHAASGTLTTQMIVAAKAVHPEYFAHQQEALLERLTDGETVPYRSRLMLSMILGQPMDPSMTPSAIMAAQAVYHMPSAKGADNQTGPGAMKSTQTGLSKLNIAGRAETPGQASESRRRDV